jgi:hypothetical protein
MRPVTQTVTGVGISAPIPMDHYISPFNIGFGVVVSAGATVSYTIQHTFNDVFAADFNPATATWFPHEDLVSQNSNQDGNYAFPIRAMRVNVGTSNGTVTLTAIQAGIAS